jgi:ABC-type multidrug transport system fused ATPase/permease subunit
MLSLVWPHRRFIFIGLAASVGFAVFNAAGVAGLIPILKVLVSDEGLHGWVDRSVAQERLGAEFNVYPVEGRPAVVQRLRPGSPLETAGVRQTDLIVTANDERVSAAELFRRVAEAPRSVTIRIGAVPMHDPGAAPAVTDLALRSVSARWQALQSVAGWIPRAQTRGETAGTLRYVLISVGAAVVISNVFRFLAQYFISVGVFRGMMDLRRRLYRQVLRLPMSFFVRDVSDLVSRFVQDVQEIQQGLNALFGRMLREPMRAAAVAVVALFLNWRLTLVMFLVAPFAVVLFTYVGRKIRRANRRLLRGYGRMIGALEITLKAIPVIRAYTSENAERKRLWQIDRRMFRQQVKIAALDAFLRPMLEVLGVVALLIVTAWLGSKVLHDEIKTDEFAALVAVLGMMFEPLRTLGELYGRIQRSAAGAQRIFGVLDAPIEQETMEGAVVLPPLSQSIEFRNVTFTYPEGATPALRGADLSVKAGEVLAIVGPNGSGKTTLMNLLLRFYDPQQGQVLIDGNDIRNVTLRSLRDQMSLVTQDALIFPVSMFENIAYGATEATEEAVHSAARRAYADEFIRALPDGYDTISGERGCTLSGGQRQRLSIARAVLRDAPILIFDEATSQIDAESEQKIQTALKEFASGRTTFVIAHRLSTIKFADRIVVLNEGRVVDTGRHEELLARCPLYQMLCRTQLVE